MRAMTNTFEGNRVVRDTGCRYPILNAPVGYFARASLTGAISAAGGFGLMETSSQGLAETDVAALSHATSTTILSMQVPHLSRHVCAA